ncbi:MAG TPA: 50S ribosomal protein L11 methyltransferase [Gammaproteobacteria bacterium]|nr:50S ribosomal protein L11 methyltransferase [Gammaproteobacteria bacterium]
MSDAWIKLALPATELAVPALERALEEAGALAVAVEALDDSAPRYAEPQYADIRLWPNCRVEGLFAADTDVDAVLAQLAAAGFAVAGARRELFADEDWQARWREQFSPLRFAGELWVVPTWHAIPAGATRIVRLDPGMAFGTGTHPTTGLCLDWLGSELALAGKSVLDYGCGSGILAIAAERHGATRIVGVDIDPQALLVARENAALNMCADIPFLLPSALGAERFEVLVANILLKPLIALAPEFDARLVSGGRLGLSGLLADQIELAMTVYAARFKMDPPVLRGEWAFLSGRKRA